jgi:cyclic pyranopterin phosphate synthase
MTNSLRISITNDCNISCSYCHNEGQPKIDTLTHMLKEDVLKIVQLGKNHGFRRIRLTGGEPTIHPQFVSICGSISSMYPEMDLSINTNGLHCRKLQLAVEEARISRVVFGLDGFINGKQLSHQESAGKVTKAEKVLACIVNLKSRGVIPEVAAVYNSSHNDLFPLVQWTLDHDVDIKVIEQSRGICLESRSREFKNLVDVIVDQFNLELRLDQRLNEAFGINRVGTKVRFFHSHCARLECAECQDMHIRVNATGEVVPCLFSSVRFPLLGNDCEREMVKALEFSSYLRSQ